MRVRKKVDRETGKQKDKDASLCALEIGVEWIRRPSYGCGCERDEERVHVTHIQTNIGEK